ncbi:methylated-DNA--[protein]-cysteine S-methyltransferase [Rhizorhapis sp. SPR117]|uniref:methylated-DNA--[protein]-cysteine S-methyltransferase n=1 Tax=Rhizorhapis sp. SPR117 TaxID=2912611 RepID=UPI0023516396
MTTLFLDHYESPIGTILLVTDERRCLRALDFADHEPRMRQLLQRHYGTSETLPLPAPTVIRDALDAYFDGDLQALSAIVWQTNGSLFQRQVWAALGDIPAGTTQSYAELAAHIGKPNAVRAVGLANGANPVGIVVPCHRVIGANGKLTGYGGGIERKAWLLEHEGALPVAHTPNRMAAAI